MADFPPFTDSPRQSAFYPPQPVGGPLTAFQSPPKANDSDASGLEKADESFAPQRTANPSPRSTVRNERSNIPISSSAPSLRGSLAARPFPATPEGHDDRSMTAEGSAQNSSHQRVSFENNHVSTSALSHSPRAKVNVHPLLREAIAHTSQGINSTITRINRASDPTHPSAGHLAGAANSPKRTGHELVPSASAPHSRASSPRRLFSWPGLYHSPEDPFIPVDPFRFRTRLRRLSLHNSDVEHNLPFHSTCEENPFCIPCLRRTPKGRFFPFLQDVRYFILVTLPKQIYLLFLLRLPSLYFSRIARVYEDAQLSKPDLERMIESYCNSGQQQQRQRIARSSPIPYHTFPALPFPDEWTSTNVPPALIKFKQSWEGFIDSLLREWKTLNLVSALLHSAIISMFQTQIMANDPVIRTAALLSLTSALMSLSFGCIYIIRFGTMRTMDNATRWAEEAARTTTFILWNVWVMLAMPVIWLAWYVVLTSQLACTQNFLSMIFFVVAILAFVWRYGSSADPTSPEPLSPAGALGPRIAISALFFLGLLYLGAIVKTLKSYGRMERKIYGEGGMRNILEEDTREGERGRQRARGMGPGRDSNRGRANSGRERGMGRGHEQDMPEPLGLSTVTGLDLKSLDEVETPGSNQSQKDRRGHQVEVTA